MKNSAAAPSGTAERRRFRDFTGRSLRLQPRAMSSPPMMPGAKRRRVSSSAETCQDLLPDPQFSPDDVSPKWKIEGRATGRGVGRWAKSPGRRHFSENQQPQTKVRRRLMRMLESWNDHTRKEDRVNKRANRHAIGRGPRIVAARSIMVALSLGLSAVSLNPHATSAATSQSAQASAIATIVRDAMKTEHLRAVIVKVTQGDKIVAGQAFGESLTGVPATTAMHFPNGAVAFAYVSTLLMEFVDEHEVKLDDTIDRWMPTLPEANKVTLKMLANHPSGYPDFETDPAWLAAWSANPFHIWTFHDRLTYPFTRPVQFAPGTNWSYAPTNFMILGEILTKIAKKPLDRHLRESAL